MQNVTYSFVNAGNNGNLVFRSSVTSFGLDHVSDKDLVSFYTNFSKYSYTDTGLLPVNGSGLLSIRSAGEHTQIAYQHAPGMYYINWGDYEGDRSATKYYVAQPYRIVIADLVNDNLLGARTFYSPVPITYPALPLYHVNLPNINCRGYRGNGVGWICLYHSEDISQYPFNEKLVRILDRCSGTEAYNDSNMSETDGPRFYNSYDKPSYIHNPSLWAAKSQAEGYEWTLDPDLWIPVLVKDLDHQDKHYDDGQPLTFVDALFGNYQAYYTDNLRPKPVNLIARNDLQINSFQVFDWFKHSYNFSSSNFTSIDTFSASTQIKNSVSSTIFTPDSFADEEDDENIIACYKCDCSINTMNEDYTVIANDGVTVCEECANEYAVWVEHLSGYYWFDDSIVTGQNDYHYSIDHWGDFIVCHHCGYHHPYDSSRGIPISSVNVWNIDQDNGACYRCASEVHYELPSEIENKSNHRCIKCLTDIPNIYDLDEHGNNVFKVKLINDISTNLPHKLVGVCNVCYDSSCTPIEKNISNIPKDYTCVCGSSVTPESMVNVADKIFINNFVFEKIHSNPSEVIAATKKLFEAAIPVNTHMIHPIKFDEITAIFTVTHLCAECCMNLESSSSQEDFIKDISNHLISVINDEMFFSQKPENIYGIKFHFSYKF